MVSVTIHNLFIDFLVSHQFGRLILDYRCGFGKYCWLYCVAIFQGHKMMKHWQFIFPTWISVSLNILRIQGKITKFWYRNQSEVWTSGYWTQRLKWLGFGVFYVPGFLLVFAVIFFSKKWIYFLRLKLMELIYLFWKEGCVLNTRKVDLLKMSPLCQ